MSEESLQKWRTFLKADRLGDGSKSQYGERSEFERDYDSIIWSDPFRRLVDKTQVFPLTENDHIHNRLTHSLEVASVGHHLGKSVGKKLAGTGRIARKDIPNVGVIVQAACLAHDIGNPPFGHFGEKVIGQWVTAHYARLKRMGVTNSLLEELKDFEGNAQGFRILARHQQRTGGGMRLTLATLAAGAKYPCSRKAGNQGKGAPPHRKKYGYFSADEVLFAEVAQGTGMLRDGDECWHRHPLAWLVEAADDIANLLVDLEDGFRAGVIPSEEVYALLFPIANKRDKVTRNEERYRRGGSKSLIAAMRSLAIGVLVEEFTDSFMAHLVNIENGTHQQSLDTLASPERKEEFKLIRRMVEERCFPHQDVLDNEIGSFRILTSLLDHVAIGVGISHERHVPKGLPEKISQTLGLGKFKAGRGEDSEPTPDEQLMEVVDCVAGMTDRFAVRIYRRIMGIELAGRLG